MDFSQVKEKQLIFAVSEGQFIGVFYIVKKHSRFVIMIASYYAGPVKLENAYKQSFDWVYKDEDDEEEVDMDFLADAVDVKYAKNNRMVREHVREIIKAILRREVSIKQWL